MAPTEIHPLLFKRELRLLLGLRLHCRIMLRPLVLRFGSVGLLRIGGSGLLPLTATTIVSSMVRVAVDTPFLFLCHRALYIRNVWPTTDHTSWRVTTIMLHMTKALAVFALYGSLGSPVCIDCHSETTERRQSTHLANKGPTSYSHYEVWCGEPVLSRIMIAALRAELLHRMNQNSEDFQLLPNILLRHVLAKSLNQKSSAPVFWQAVGVECHSPTWFHVP
jgi:hypothetical protein